MSNSVFADVLDIDDEEYSFEDPTKKVNLVVVDTGDDENDDYTLSRSTLRAITTQGANALSELLTVAKTSQKARDYEVAAKLIDTLAALTKGMRDLHKKETSQRVSKLDGESDTNSINIEKAVFVGTTSQLLHEIRKDK